MQPDRIWNRIRSYWGAGESERHFWRWKDWTPADFEQLRKNVLQCRTVETVECGDSHSYDYAVILFGSRRTEIGCYQFALGEDAQRFAEYVRRKRREECRAIGWLWNMGHMLSTDLSGRYDYQWIRARCGPCAESAAIAALCPANLGRAAEW